MPEFAHDLGHGEAGFTYSALFGADAAGAFTAGIVLESRGLLPPAPRTAFLLALGWCISIGTFAWTTSYPFALLLLFICGFLELSFYAMAQTLVQLNAPPPIRGRKRERCSPANLARPMTTSNISAPIGTWKRST